MNRATAVRFEVIQQVDHPVGLAGSIRHVPQHNQEVYVRLLVRL